MNVNSIIDGLIEPFSPRMALRRQQFRNALTEARQYDAAAVGRRTAGWRRTGSSANVEIARGLARLRNGSRELVRNNKYAATAIRLLTAYLVGDGVGWIIKHADEKVQAAARAEMKAWAESPVDGRNDAYGVQKQAVRAWKEGGESLLVWSSSQNGYLDRVRVLEGDFLDQSKTGVFGGNRVIQGVEFDADNHRVAFWLFDEHPGDTGLGFGPSRRWIADHIDHVFDEQRPGQARGVPVLSPVMLDLKDHGDVEDAKVMQEKIAACLAIILSSKDDQPPAIMGETSKAADAKPGAPAIETIRPGMIWRTRQGDDVTTLQPAQTNSGVEFSTKRLMAISACTGIPYFMLAGDPTQSSYSSQRAVMLPFWSLLDDEQQNIIIPFIARGMFRRRMFALYLRTGDRRFLEVTCDYAMPIRRMLDPQKDLAGEVGETRAGYKTFTKSLQERGKTLEDFIAEKKEEQAALDAAGIVLEVDVRKVTDSGILQAPSGLALPKQQ